MNSDMRRLLLELVKDVLVDVRVQSRDLFHSWEKDEDIAGDLVDVICRLVLLWSE